jgi:hypothetical protein
LALIKCATPLAPKGIHYSKTFLRYRSFDPTDKIYTLLGLSEAPGLDSLTIEPNYELEVAALYNAVAVEIIK